MSEEFGDDDRWHYVGALKWKMKLSVYQAEVTDQSNGWYVARVLGPPRGLDVATKRHASFLASKAWAEEWIKAAEVEAVLLAQEEKEEVEL